MKLWKSCFSHVCLSVCLSVYKREGVPMWPLPLDLTIQGPHPPAPPLDMGPHCTGTPSPSPLLVTSDGQHLTPVQTCSPENLPSGTHIWWLLKQIRYVSKGNNRKGFYILTHPSTHTRTTSENAISRTKCWNGDILKCEEFNVFLLKTILTHTAEIFTFSLI